MKETMQITDLLCQVLQPKSQDILNAMHFVSSTKGVSNNTEMINEEFYLPILRRFAINIT
jgi:hypothetical protein